jgi:hypothetical protein
MPTSLKPRLSGSYRSRPSSYDTINGTAFYDSIAFNEFWDGVTP